MSFVLEAIKKINLQPSTGGGKGREYIRQLATK